MINFVSSPFPHFPIAFYGPALEEGPLPAFFYFAFSAEESLQVDFGPIPHINAKKIRVFSFTIPAHGPGEDKHHAMQKWITAFTQEEEEILSAFFDQALKAIQWLQEQSLLIPGKIAFGGLSRGGFIATHLAARFPSCHALLGYAPLTDLSQLLEAQPHADNSSLQQTLATWNLTTLIPALTHLHHVRFHLGLRDTRVNTDAVYRFMREYEDYVHIKRVRHCHLELFLSSSIGHKGHGTSPASFQKGAEWLNTIFVGG